MIYQTRVTRSGRGVLIPHSRSFFKDIPASRTSSVIPIPKRTFSFLNTAPVPRIQPIPLPESGQIPYRVHKMLRFSESLAVFQSNPGSRKYPPRPWANGCQDRIYLICTVIALPYLYQGSCSTALQRSKKVCPRSVSFAC